MVLIKIPKINACGVDDNQLLTLVSTFILYQVEVSTKLRREKEQSSVPARHQIFK